MEWYPLRDTVRPFLGDRLTTLFAHAISAETDCLICSTFFRRMLIDSGENPDRLTLDERDRVVVAYGRQLATDSHAVSDAMYARSRAPLHRRSRSWRSPPSARSCTPPTSSTTRFGWISTSTSSRIAGASAAGAGAGRADGRVLGAGRARHRCRSRPGPRLGARTRPRGRQHRRARCGAADGLPRLRDGVVRRPRFARRRVPRAWASSAAPSSPTCATIAAVTAAVDATVAAFGRIDILFNNAGICAYGLAHELTEEAWDAMLDINLKGSWLVARRVIPVMIRQKSGVILNNSSVAGLRGMGRLSHYAASKWGLTGLTKSWAIELAPHGIRVNSIHPTGVNTPMNDGLAALEGLTTQGDRGALGGKPAAGALGRAGGCRRGGGLPRVRSLALRDRRPIRARRRPAQPVSVVRRRSLRVTYLVRASSAEIAVARRGADAGADGRAAARRDDRLARHRAGRRARREHRAGRRRGFSGRRSRSRLRRPRRIRLSCSTCSSATAPCSPTSSSPTSISPTRRSTGFPVLAPESKDCERSPACPSRSLLATALKPMGLDPDPARIALSHVRAGRDRHREG